MTNEPYQMTAPEDYELYKKLERIPFDRWELTGSALEGILNANGKISTRLDDGTQVEIERRKNNPPSVKVTGKDYEAFCIDGYSSIRPYREIVEQQRKIIEEREKNRERSQREDFRRFLGRD